MCLAKNVFVKPVRSAIGLLLASAHQEVNSKRVRRLAACACRRPLLVDVLTSRVVLRVVLRQRAVADHEELHVLEQARAGPEAVALVAVDLVERLADVDAAALELDVHHRQAVDEDRDVVAVATRGAASTSYWLMTCSRLLWMFGLSIS